MNAHSDSKAPRVFPGILFLLAIPLLLGGLQLVLLGGSLYYPLSMSPARIIGHYSRESYPSLCSARGF